MGRTSAWRVGLVHPAKPRTDRYLNRRGYLTAWTGGENREHVLFSKMLARDNLKVEQLEHKAALL